VEAESSKEEPTTSCGSTTIRVRLMTCVGILERVGRPSRPAPRRPPTAVLADSAARRFGGRAARRPLSGRRLVSSCDGPMPASPASIFLSTATRRWSRSRFRWTSEETVRGCGRRHARSTTSTKAGGGEAPRRPCCALAGTGAGEGGQPWQEARGASLAPRAAPPRPPPSRPRSSTTRALVSDVWWRTALDRRLEAVCRGMSGVGANAPRALVLPLHPRAAGDGTSSKTAGVDPPPAPWRRTGARGVRAFWLDWQRGAALEAAQSARSTWFIWFGICFVFGAEESASFFFFKYFS